MFTGSDHCPSSKIPLWHSTSKKRKTGVSSLGSFYVVELLASRLVVMFMALPALVLFILYSGDTMTANHNHYHRVRRPYLFLNTTLLKLAYNFFYLGYTSRVRTYYPTA